MARDRKMKSAVTPIIISPIPNPAFTPDEWVVIVYEMFVWPGNTVSVSPSILANLPMSAAE
jgi:hypothetical protein